MPSTAPSHPEPPFSILTRKAKVALLGLFSLTAILWLGSRTLLAANFLPHLYCYVGKQRLLWSNVIADLVIGLSYVAISATLVWLVRRAGPDLPYPYFFWAFGLFIVSYGATHFAEVVTIWKPVYWLLAAVKAEGFPESELPPNSIFLQKPFRFASLFEQLKLIRRGA